MIPAAHINEARIVALSGLTRAEAIVSFDALIAGMERQLYHVMMRDTTNWTLVVVEARQLRDFLLGLRGGSFREDDRIVSLHPVAENKALSSANLERRYMAYKSLLGLLNRVTITMRRDLECYRNNLESRRPMPRKYLIEPNANYNTTFNNVFTLVTLLAAHVRKMVAAINIWLHVLAGTATEEDAPSPVQSGMGHELEYRENDTWGEFGLGNKA